MVLGRGEARPQHKSIKNVNIKDVRRRGSYSVTGIVILLHDKITIVVILSWTMRDRITTIVILSRSYSITLHRLLI